MFAGIEREQLVRDSFLLSIPAIIGAVVIDAVWAQDTQEAPENIPVIGIESYALGNYFCDCWLSVYSHID
jgi:undecaprenyl pyrophosphate phosphatase UppP